MVLRGFGLFLSVSGMDGIAAQKFDEVFGR